MNPQTQPTQLKPGDIRQAGDTIETKSIRGSDYVTGSTHEIAFFNLRPIAPHTIGRVILQSDLCNARFFRP